MERLSVGARVLMALGSLTVVATSLASVSSGWKAQWIFAGLLLALPAWFRWPGAGDRQHPRCHCPQAGWALMQLPEAMTDATRHYVLVFARTSQQCKLPPAQSWGFLNASDPKRTTFGEIALLGLLDRRGDALALPEREPCSIFFARSMKPRNPSQFEGQAYIVLGPDQRCLTSCALATLRKTSSGTRAAPGDGAVAAPWRRIKDGGRRVTRAVRRSDTLRPCEVI